MLYATHSAARMTRVPVRIEVSTSESSPKGTSEPRKAAHSSPQGAPYDKRFLLSLMSCMLEVEACSRWLILPKCRPGTS